MTAESPSSQTIQALLLAKLNLGGKGEVVSTLHTLLSTESSANFDESAFRLCSKIVFRELKGSLDDFRKDLREISAADPTMKETSLNLTKSIRVAEVATNKAQQKSGARKKRQMGKETAKQKENKAWKTATQNLLDFVTAFDIAAESQTQEVPSGDVTIE